MRSGIFRGLAGTQEGTGGGKDSQAQHTPTLTAAKVVERKAQSANTIFTRMFYKCDIIRA
jgi:hypothetical protein